MDWKQILGDVYVEGMSEEESQARFNEIYIPKSQHDSAILKEKATRDELEKENAGWKRKYREKQTQEERKAEELAEQQAKKDAEVGLMQRELNIIRMSKQYMGMGYDEEFATDTATAFVDGDMDTVFSNQKIFSENLRKTIKSDLMKEMPIPPAGNETKVDYSKQIAEAQEKNDMVAMAALIRQQAAANAQK